MVLITENIERKANGKNLVGTKDCNQPRPLIGATPANNETFVIWTLSAMIRSLGEFNFDLLHY